jgi:hypothetical protein
MANKLFGRLVPPGFDLSHHDSQLVLQVLALVNPGAALEVQVARYCLILILLIHFLQLPTDDRTAAKNCRPSNGKVYKAPDHGDFSLSWFAV